MNGKTQLAARALLVWMTLFLILMVVTPVFAQGRVKYSFNFNLTARNQSMWSNTGTNRVDYTYFLGTTFSSSDSYGGYFDFFGDTGVEGSASISGAAGLTFSAYADGGSVDITYPVTVELLVPEREFLVPGGPVVIHTTLKRNGTATVTTRTPDANVILRGTFNSTASVSMTGKISGRTLFDGEILPRSIRNIDLRVDFFNLRDYLLPGSSDLSIDLIPRFPNLLRADLHYPIIEISASNSSTNGLQLPVRGNGSDRVFTLTGNITAALVYLIQSFMGMPPFNFLEQGITFPPNSAVYTFSAGYSILRAEARGVIGFKQDVEFLPRPKIRLEKTDGTFLAEARVGEPLIITMPTTGALNIRAKLLFENDFKNTFYLTLGGGLYFIPFEFYASGSIGPFSLGGFSLIPIDPFAIEGTHPFKLFERNFTMGGFEQPVTSSVPVQANTSTDPAIFYSVNFPGATEARIGDTSAVLKIEGRPLGFLNAQSVVYVNNIAIPTTFSNQNLLTATLTRPQHDSILNTLRLDGYPVQVRTPGKPDSNLLNFPVGYKRPLISRVVAGTNFENYLINSRGNTDLEIWVESQNNTFTRDVSIVYWNEIPLRTIYDEPFDGGIVRAIVPAKLLNTGVPQPPGGGPNIKITVRSPLPGGGTSNEWGVYQEYPYPTFNEDNDRALQPQAGYSVGEDGLAITVQGADFLKGESPGTSTIVQFQRDGIDPPGQWHNLETSFVTDTKLIAVIPANLLETAGPARVRMLNPSNFTGGQPSDSKFFYILNPVPVVYRCDPNIVSRGSGTMTVKVLGTGFKNGIGLQVYYNNAPRATTFVSPNELRFTVTAAEMASGGVNKVKVRVPQTAPYPAVFSNEEWFTVRNPKPTLTSLEPATRQIFTSGFNLKVRGTGFENSAKVYWNGAERPTTFINSTQVEAQIPASDLQYPGTVEITAQNYPSEISNALPFTLTEAPIIYVTPQGNDANSGNSWANAKRTIQAGINAASSGQQVWVKAGVYNELLTLKNGVRVFGGFAGNETARIQRDLYTYETVIDAGGLNARAVVAPANTNNGTVLDGFTIRNSNIAADGAGIYMTNSSAVISNNFIINNQSPGFAGAGIFISGGSPLIINNVIARNTARNTAGVYLYGTTAQLINNTITHNTSTNSATGAAVYASDNTNVLLANNIVAFQAGGANIERKNVGSASITLRNNCVFGASQNYKGITQGTTDIVTNPDFLNANANDFHLFGLSPCIDRGNDADIASQPVDMDGQNRINLVSVDIGADELYAYNTQVISLTVTPSAQRIGQMVSFKAQLREPITQRTLPNLPIVFKIDGVEIGSGSTNIDGAADLNYVLPPNFGTGTKQVTAEFPGNGRFNPSSTTGSMTINKAVTTLQIANVSGEVGQTVPIIATLTYGNAVPLAGKTVSIQLDGNLLGNITTNSMGEAIISYPIPRLRAGAKSITAQFAGDSLFEPSNASNSLIVNNTKPVAALAGAAISLDGTNDYAQAPNGVYFNGDFTIEGWVNVRSHNAWARLLDFGNASPMDNVLLALSDGSTGRPAFWTFNGTVGSGITAPNPLPLNQWVHLAATLQGTTARLYVNGSLVASGTLSVPRNVVRTRNYIGRSNWLQDAYANAQVDEIRIWNRARSQTEIQRDYQASLRGDERGLIAYYRADEGNGSLLNDSSGNSSNANLHNEPQWVASTAVVQRINILGLRERNFTLNGFDINTDPLTFTILSQERPNNGAVMNGSGANRTYLPFVRNGSDYIRFNADDGTDVSDEAVMDVNLIDQAVSTLASGMLYLDGTSGKAEVNHSSALNAYPLTLEAWVKTSQTIGQQGLLNKYSSGSFNGYQLFLLNGELRAWYFRNGSNHVFGGGDGLNAGFIADGRWHHIAFVVDENGGRVYVDGELRASRVWTGAPGATSTTMPFSIGFYNSPVGGYFNGLIDEVRIWNRSRSRTELLRDAQAILQGNEPGLVAYYRLDEGRTTNSITDSAGGDQNGTLLGTWARLASGAPLNTIQVQAGSPRNFLLGGYSFGTAPNFMRYTVLSNPAQGNLSGGDQQARTYTPAGGGIFPFLYKASFDPNDLVEPAVGYFIVRTPGDANLNGCVDDADLLLILFAFGSDDPDADVNADGIVDDADLLTILFNFGNGC